MPTDSTITYYAVSRRAQGCDYWQEWYVTEEIDRALNVSRIILNDGDSAMVLIRRRENEQSYQARRRNRAA